MNAQDTSVATDINTPKSFNTGIRLQRFFTAPRHDPLDEVVWTHRDVLIKGADGQPVFEQKNVKAPSSWSQLAVQVTASKYFRGTLGTPERESSVRQMIERVVKTIVAWGKKDKYFTDDLFADIFRDELTYLLVNQHMAFNSPVWFNVGVPDTKPQCSACFINSVDDTMESILDLAKTEGMLFKYGSGTGSNLSTIRSSKELLQGGGNASGPVSFMRGFDAFAGVIKSGGKTRRAAKMVILNADHPDILEFVRTKVEAERVAQALIAANFSTAFNEAGSAYDYAPYQNANHSVRVTDEFMRMVSANEGGKQALRAVKSREEIGSIEAASLFRTIAEAAWACGDPGLQFDTTIQAWNTSKGSGRINATNPCSEFVYLDDTACNLASLNLMKFVDDSGAFNVMAFRHAVDVSILAMEILVGNSTYPTEKITKNSHDLRPLGLGYANLGALLMSSGLPYDSDEGRAYAASITALMHCRAYQMSAVISKYHGGPFAAYGVNVDSMLEVLKKHADAVQRIGITDLNADVVTAALVDAEQMIDLATTFGVRNAQVTVLAPTGTIGFMMDCDTTGIEPDIALVKTKHLVGGGVMKYVNQSIPLALLRLGYATAAVDVIVAYVAKTGTIEGAPGLKPEHLPIFDCALATKNSTRTISWLGHVKMMGVVQPFLSGAISKTVNMPSDATVEDIERAFMEAWHLGLKAIAIYRDGCKQSQPLTTKASEKKPEGQVVTFVRANVTNDACATCKKAIKTTDTFIGGPDGNMHHFGCFKPSTPVRRKLPDTCNALRHKFRVGNHKGYIHVGEFEDGTFGEVFIDMSKEGSIISGLLGAVGALTSIAVQYGVPLSTLVEKFAHTSFEPSGFTTNPEIGRASSLLDYVFRWLSLRYIEQPKNLADALQKATTEEPVTAVVSAPPATVKSMTHSDAPPCHVCGALMVRNGACHKCLNCGSTSGCS